MLGGQASVCGLSPHKWASINKVFKAFFSGVVRLAVFRSDEIL